MIEKLKNRFIRAYTLIEMAVVLIIIGLIVAGFIMSRGFVGSAQVTTIISEFTYYQNAKKTFMEKYKYIPGDVPTSEFVRYFNSGTANSMTGTTAAGAYTCNITTLGNNILDRDNISTPSYKTTEENLVWIEMSYTDFIKDRIVSDPCASPAAGISQGQNRPESSISPGVGYTLLGKVSLTVNSNTYVYMNVFRLGQQSSDNQLSTGFLLPSLARSIDMKIDTADTPYTGKFFVDSACIDPTTFVYIDDTTNVLCVGNLAEVELGTNTYTP